MFKFWLLGLVTWLEIGRVVHILRNIGYLRLCGQVFSKKKWFLRSSSLFYRAFGAPVANAGLSLHTVLPLRLSC